MGVDDLNDHVRVSETSIVFFTCKVTSLSSCLRRNTPRSCVGTSSSSVGPTLGFSLH